MLALARSWVYRHPLSTVGDTSVALPVSCDFADKGGLWRVMVLIFVLVFQVVFEVMLVFAAALLIWRRFVNCASG